MTQPHNAATMDDTPLIDTDVSMVSPIMRWFDYAHLPEKLQPVSERFYHLAWAIEKTTSVGPEKSACLRRLLEAKDCAVRASMA